MYGASHLGRGLDVLYIGFLVGVLFLGLFVANNVPVGAGGNFALSNLVVFSFLAALITLLYILARCDRSRTKAVKDVTSLFKRYYDLRDNDDTARNVEDELMKKTFNEYL